MTHPIALSTGWLFTRSSIPALPTHTPFVDIVDGVELNFGGNPSQRLNVYETPAPDEWATEYLSFHLPRDGVETHVDRLQNAAAIHNPETAVIHPTGADFDTAVQCCLDADLPVAIENMEGRAERGVDPAELRAYIDEYDVGFVLDVQHAYEHDASMEYAWDLVEMAGDALCELHVSGHTRTNKHALLTEATNQQPIRAFLTDLLSSYTSLPIVIEGQYTSVRDVKQEYELLDGLRREC